MWMFRLFLDPYLRAVKGAGVPFVGAVIGLIWWWCLLYISLNAFFYFRAREKREVAKQVAALTGWFSVFFFYYALLHFSDVLWFLATKDAYEYSLSLAMASLFFVSSSVMFAAFCIIRAGHQGD